MEYNHNRETGYLVRAKRMQEIDRRYYQPYQQDCHRMVWMKYIYPIYGCTYHAFLRYLKADVSGVSCARPAILDLR